MPTPTISPFFRLPNCSNEKDVSSFHYYIHVPPTLVSNDNTQYDYCIMDYKKIIASRIYFSVALVNIVFVVMSTALFIYFAVNTRIEPWFTMGPIDEAQPKYRRLWRRNTLNRRSIFATTLGATGHLIFSTIVLMSEAFYTESSCKAAVWGVIFGFYTWIFAFSWSAYRLHFLIRLHALKTLYAMTKTGRASISSSNNNNNTMPSDQQVTSSDRDYRWFLRNRECKKLTVSRAMVWYFVFLVPVFAVLVPIHVYGAKEGVSFCESRWTIYPIVGYVTFFFVIVAPIICWKLRGKQDAHNIRNEIILNIVIGVPLFVLTLVWFGFYGRRLSSPTGDYFRFFFPPRMWIVAYTTAAHVISVIVPLCYLVIEKCHPTSPADRSQSSILVRPNRQQQLLEATPETLENELRKAEALNKMGQLAVKDFSSENVLFYQSYLELLDKVEARGQPSSTTTVYPLQQQQQQQTFWTNKNLSMHVPIDQSLLHDFFDFYCNYICEGAPLQVNITYRARSQVDAAFETLKNKRGKSDQASSAIRNFYHDKEPRLPSFATDSNSNVRSGNQAAATATGTIQPDQITLAVFETARKEVFWNIFGSVFPKYVVCVNKARRYS